ncbi:MAG TPA: hypothetical protein VH207_16700 [Chthoniobacterales bacterium]|jgi:hypothetical protein|nr:hypothetical protein [Chthoniobacterales bacterium]
MKTKFALSLLATLTLLPACTTTERASNQDYKGGRYADSPVGEPAPPAEGPRDVNANPAYMPSPLLRASAAGGL